METDKQEHTPRPLPGWLRVEDLGPRLRRVYLADQPLALGDVLQMEALDVIPDDTETIIGTVHTGRPFRKDRRGPASHPVREVLVESHGALELFVVLDTTTPDPDMSREEYQRSLEAVYGAPRVLLASWTEAWEGQK